MNILKKAGKWCYEKTKQAVQYCQEKAANVSTVVKTAAATGLSLAGAAIASATPTPLEDAVTALTSTTTEILGQAATVVGLGLSLFAVSFGVRWVMRVLRGTSK